ncbi:MAG: ABC transporter ATP-binding protein [Planctomycetaceae bacterium]|nr:ABC transporter ATP-binding protein [Planctomycetaceae bacterium]
MEPAVSYSSVSKVYRDFFLRARVRTLDRFDLTIAPGETIGLIGPNGSGKSTAINLLVGLLKPSSGTVRLMGRDPREPSSRRELGYLPEENANYPFLTAHDAMWLHARVAGLSRNEARARCDELLERLGLAHARKRRAGTFSKGMGRRLGIAQALIAKPRVLVLDEPTTGLDPVGTRDVLELFASLKRDGVTMLVSSHILSEIEGVCDRVVMLDHGRILKTGTTAEMLTLRDQHQVRFAGGGPDMANELEAWLKARGAEILSSGHPTRSLADVYRELLVDHKQGDKQS